MNNRRQKRFQPSLDNSLETRVVMSAGLRLSRQAAAVTDRSLLMKNRPLPVQQNIDLAFNSFAEQYGQARALYFSAVTGPDPSSVSNEAFRQYTTQRVNALAQDLIAAFQASPVKKSKGHGAANSNADLRSLVNRKINGRTLTNDTSVVGTASRGTLLRALIDSTPAVTGSTPLSSQTAAFQILAQDSAIATARGAIANGLTNYRLKLTSKRG